ncbi:MAG: SDR family NAD(P)-dependent oxidoreductase [Spirochaetes bacterium]|nr:SDR family NAD(P)-dependent oxidoreductase [Spirochaetota bacterium]
MGTEGENGHGRPLQDRVILVTGASRGIGKAIAKRLAIGGARLALVGRGLRGLEEASRELGPTGGEALLLPYDLTEASSYPRILKAILERWGRLDALVNNAGIAETAPFESETPDAWDRLLAVNARAPFFLTQAVLPELRKTKGRIVNIASVVAHTGYAQQAAYSASKHALLGWTKALARELVSDGVRVHIIAPGGVATEMVSRMRPDIRPEELIQPEEVAEAVAYLLSMNGRGVVDEIQLRRADKTPF